MAFGIVTQKVVCKIRDNKFKKKYENLIKTIDTVPTSKRSLENKSETKKDSIIDMNGLYDKYFK